MTEFVKHVYVLNPSTGGSGGGVVEQGEPNADCSKAWPVKFSALFNDSIVCIDAGDFLNNALRVNVVAGLPVAGTVVDYSTTITNGGTDQVAIPPNSTRKYLFIQNVSSGDLWFNFDIPATLSFPSIKLLSGEKFVMESSYVSTQEIHIIGATTGQEFVAKEGN